MRHPLLCLIGLAILLSACDEERPNVWSSDKQQTLKEDEVRAVIAKLVVGEREAADVEADLDFEDLVQQLRFQGSTIETVLIEELGATSSWGVRKGIIEVLTATGSKRSVEAILACLQDENDEVAWKALWWLRVILKHQEAPDKPDAVNPLPPLPDTIEAWPEYRRRFGASLHQRWTKWWEANRNDLTID